MKKEVLILGLLLFFFQANAQDKTRMIGTWVFKEVYIKNKIQSEELKLVTNMVTDMTMVFTEETVSIYKGGITETCKWNFAEENPRIIYATTETGKEIQITITKPDVTEITAKIGIEGVFVFSKQ